MLGIFSTPPGTRGPDFPERNLNIEMVCLRALYRKLDNTVGVVERLSNIRIEEKMRPFKSMKYQNTCFEGTFLRLWKTLSA